MESIANIKTVSQDDYSLYGHKAAGLGQLSKEFNIANGYVLSKDLFDKFIDHNQFRGKIGNLLSMVEDDEYRLENISEELQKLILSGDMPPVMKEAISEVYYSLNIKDSVPLQEMMDTQSEPIVIVRSSPVGAGDHLSILHVQGKDKLIKSIQAVFASSFTPASIRLRGKGGYDTAVIIQNMIIPYIAGQIYQVDNIIVEACYGLSDNHTKFDRFAVDQDMKIVNSLVEPQEEAYMLDEKSGNLAKISLPEEKASGAKLNDKQVEVLARLWDKADLRDYKIEFIIDKDNYYFVQVEKMEQKEDENTLFSLFKSKNSGQTEKSEEPEKQPDEQQSEQSVQPDGEVPKSTPIPQQEPQPEEPMSLEPTPQESVPNETVAQEPVPQESAPKEPVQQEPVPGEPVQEEVSQEPVEEPVPQEPEQDAVPSAVTESEQQFNDQAQEDKNPSEMFEEPVDPEEIIKAQSESVNEILETDSTCVPLSSDEWLETINMEHTRALVAYDLAIARALRQKHNQVFQQKPNSFVEMVDNLSEKVTIPYAEQIKGVHVMRNRFLKEHKTISIDELKVAYDITENFLKEFK